MNETPSAQGGPGGPTGLGDELRALRRSSSQRVVAGVLGGLGQRIGIDPVVLRIATAVLALFGGVGILLYAAAWLLVPADDAPGSILDQALGRTDERESSAGPMALFLAAVVVVTFGIVVSGSWISFPLLALAVVGLVMLYRRKDDERTTSDQPLPPTETDQDAGYPLSWPDQAGWPEGPDWDAAYDSPPPSVVEEPPPPKKQRSPLGLVTVLAALVAVGVLAINETTWASFPTSIYVAVPLAIVGLGLLAGAWFGRSRALIVLGILLTVVLIPWTFVDDHWEGAEFGTIDKSITSTAELRRLDQPIKVGGGDVTYDLSQLSVRENQTAVLEIQQGGGELTVYVPEGAEVDVDARIGAGEITVFDQNGDGVDRRFSENQPGEGGTIELDLRLDFGELIVEAR